MLQVLWTPHYRPALDTPAPSRLWTLTLSAPSPSNASGHQIAVAQACGLKLNLCHKNSLLRLLRLSIFWTNTWHMKFKLLTAPFWARTTSFTVCPDTNWINTENYLGSVLGSKALCNPSPKKLIAMTVKNIIAPG